MQPVDLRRADCFEFLEELEDGSVDAVITDPPFGTMDAKWDVQLDLDAWWALVRRKLKPAGVVVCFAAGRFLFRLHASNERWYRYDLIWEKSKSVGFLNANVMPLRAHEFILVFTPALKSSCYNPQKIASGGRALGVCRKTKKQSTLYRGHGGDYISIDDGTRHPRSVLRFNSVTNDERLHPTQKPLELMCWLVRTFSNAGDLVVDPFSGSGSTPEACLIEGRRFAGCERDPSFYRLAVNRLARRMEEQHDETMDHRPREDDRDSPGRRRLPHDDVPQPVGVGLRKLHGGLGGRQRRAVSAPHHRQRSRLQPVQRPIHASRSRVRRSARRAA